MTAVLSRLTVRATVTTAGPQAGRARAPLRPPITLDCGRVTGDATTGSDTPAITSSICTRASPISRKRAFGSFLRQRMSNRRSAAGVSAGNSDQSGSLVTTATIRSVVSSPSNARRPVSISYRTTPNAQMSARRSTTRPRACSGAMYAAVPRIIPSCVARPVMVGEFMMSVEEAGSDALAKPKSSTFTVPSARTLMFWGLMSRWMMPCSCAASTASAICRAICSASASSRGPRATTSERSGPSTSSITSAVRCSVRSKP